MVQVSAEKPEHTVPAEKERVASVPQREQCASTLEPPLPNGKKQSCMSRASDHKGRESQGEREPHLGEKERAIRARAWRGKDGLHVEGRLVAKRRESASEVSLSKIYCLVFQICCKLELYSSPQVCNAIIDQQSQIFIAKQSSIIQSLQARLPQAA